MTTRHAYDQGLEMLRKEIILMGELVARAIGDAVTSLAQKDVELARKVMEGDDAIDALEVSIEDRCMLLIAKQQPMARDLRIISTGLKITTDLERMGDHAYDIAKVTILLANEPLIKPLIDIPRMAQMVQKMLSQAMEAYTNMDITLAEQVCLADDAVDQLQKQMFRELLTFMLEDPKKIGQATQLILVGRFLERFADHATNIAEWVIYLATGQRLRKK